MGIRGLTTFIQSRSNMYMEKYELHDTSLVLDGNSVACQLYRWHTSSNDCYGGDYDKFARVITNFFQLLFECNVTPYVIFDGGYEKRKVATVISRMKNKIKSANQLNIVTESSISVFPLLLRMTFLEIVAKLNIKMLRCDFEGDSEIASIARILNCPVLSYDSDYYIFDVLYIPFSTLEMCVKKSKIKSSSEQYMFMPCEVYRVEKFLECFEGLNKTTLPILAVLLGNDYVKRSVFSSFFYNLKMQRCNSANEGQKRIKSLIMWLQNETIETAIEKVLGRYKKEKRKFVLDKIQNAIQGYNKMDSEYLAYLGLTPPVFMEDKVTLPVVNVNEEEIPGLEEDGGNDSDSEEDSSNDETLLEEAAAPRDIPSMFLQKFRECQYPPSFINILFQHKYYCEPQVEMSTLPNSHLVSYDILSAIHKILTNSDDHLICIGRIENEQVGKKEVGLCDFDLPTLLEIQSLNIDQRRKILFKVLKLDESLMVYLKTFPKSWHLFIIAIQYLMSRSSVGWPLIYSILLCKVILKHVDEKIGFIRSVKELRRKFDILNKSAQTVDHEPTNHSKESVNEALDEISNKDCKACMEAVIHFFEIDIKAITNRSFDRNLVHSISQFQSCLMHIGHLNSILNLPFSNFLVSECLNCTFIYNSTKNFSKRTNLDEYVKILLQNCPSILYSYSLALAKVKEITCDNVVEETRPKRRRRKKKKDKIIKEDDEAFPDIVVTDEEFMVDPNNKFAVLSISKID